MGWIISQKQKKEKTGATGKGRLTREPIDKCILEKKSRSKQLMSHSLLFISIKSCVKEDLRSVPTIKQGKAVLIIKRYKKILSSILFL